MTSATTEPSRATAGTARKATASGLPCSCLLLVMIGILARGAVLLAEAMMVRLSRASPAAPRPARPWSPRRHPAGITEAHACGGSARNWQLASDRST